VAITKAEGEYKVAIEQCEALEDDAQDECKNAAEQTYDAAKRDAEALRGPNM
jgi:hypothetical protein